MITTLRKRDSFNKKLEKPGYLLTTTYSSPKQKKKNFSHFFDPSLNKIKKKLKLVKQYISADFCDSDNNANNNDNAYYAYNYTPNNGLNSQNSLKTFGNTSNLPNFSSLNCISEGQIQKFSFLVDSKE